METDAQVLAKLKLDGLVLRYSLLFAVRYVGMAKTLALSLVTMEMFQVLTNAREIALVLSMGGFAVEEAIQAQEHVIQLVGMDSELELNNANKEM